MRMAGRHFCVSYAKPQDVKTCLQIGQSVMFDNGAFSVHTRGETLDVKGYYDWLSDKLAPPHWAVVPDAIKGGLEEQYALLATWPRHALGYDNCAAVFHLHEPLEHLIFLCNAFPKVCLGSSAQYWNVGSPIWLRRMDEIFNLLAKQYRQMPWINGMRMMGQTDGGWPLASADSTNVAQNFKRDTGCAECKAGVVDASQPSPVWAKRDHEQAELF